MAFRSAGWGRLRQRERCVPALGQAPALDGALHSILGLSWFRSGDLAIAIEHAIFARRDDLTIEELQAMADFWPSSMRNGRSASALTRPYIHIRMLSFGHTSSGFLSKDARQDCRKVWLR